jgi:protein SCO1
MLNIESIAVVAPGLTPPWRSAGLVRAGKVAAAALVPGLVNVVAPTPVQRRIHDPVAGGVPLRGEGLSVAFASVQRRTASVLALAALAAITAFGGTAAWAQPPAAQTGANGVVRSVRSYPIPAVRLQSADGSTRTLKDTMSDGRPVVMTFMYTSCATVCPITNQTLVAFEQLLGAEGVGVNTVSISIDPDHDSVKKLAAYARQTGARGSFYTSDPGTSEAVQRAFDAWRGDKMNHQPVFLLSLRPDRQWLRLDGLVTPTQLLSEYRKLISQGL